MSTRLRSIATAGLLAVLAVGLYANRMNTALSAAESDLLRQASGVGSAASGFPLFFQLGDEHWLQPVAVYATALAGLVAAPDHAGGLAAAAVGGLNVAMIFLLARRFQLSMVVAVGTALLLMATPAHIAYARTGDTAIYPLPFVLTWLLAMVAYFERGDRRLVAVGALALGAGVYSHPSAPLTMGFLLGVTLVALWISGRTRWLTRTPLAAGPFTPRTCARLLTASWPS